MTIDLPDSGKNYIKTDDLITLAETIFEKLKIPGDVTAWMDLIRTCRQPQVMWNVDYIEPNEHLPAINDLIRCADEIIYQQPNSIELKNGYSAEINQQAAYNTIRVHLNSEDGHIEISLQLLKEMLREQYDDLSVIRQSNLLFHSSLIFLCCKKLELSYHNMQKHWALLKYSKPSERIQLGLWDNQCLLEMTCWFFVKHCEEFRDFYSIKTKTSCS